MSRWMAHTAGGLLLAVPFLVGCNLFPGLRNKVQPPPAATAGPTGKPTVESLVEYMNQEAARVQNIRARVDIDARGGGQTIGLSGQLAAARPRQFRLKADVLGKSACDIGSNSEEFWYWVSQDNPPYLYHCSYRDLATGKVNVPFPFQPDMVVAALGIAEYDRNGKYELRDVGKTWQLRQVTTTADGKPATRITVFDKARQGPDRPQVLAHVLFDARGKLVCQAMIERVRQDPDTGARVPSVVKIDWPEMKASMKLMLNSVEANRIDAATAGRVFSRAGLQYQAFDLARGGSTTSLQQTGALVPRR